MNLFENQQIDIDELPRMQSVSYIKPKISFLTLTLLKSIAFWLFMTGMFIMSSFAASQEFSHLIPYARYVFYPFALLSILLTLIGYYKRGHALREFDIIYKEGVLFNNTTTISFNRVQHCEISQGPLEQVFELYTLKVFTAGGQSSDLEIPGLDEQTANGLKEYIVDATAKKSNSKVNSEIGIENTKEIFQQIIAADNLKSDSTSEEQ